MIPGQIQQILAGQPLIPAAAAPPGGDGPPDDDNDKVVAPPVQADLEEPPAPSPSGASMGAQMEAKNPGFLSRLFGNANKAADADPSAASKPGGWAKALVAGVSGAAQGVLHDFSDIGAAKDAGSGIQGIAAVQGARTARIQAAADKQRKQAQENVELDDKHQQAQALLAHTKIQQLYTERLVHNLDEESLDKSIAAGEKEIAQTTTGEFGAPVYEKDVTSDEYNRFLQDKKNSDPDSRVEDFHAVPSGKVADPSQPTGYRTLYTIVGTPKTQKLTQDFVDSVNPGLPDAQKLKAGDNEIPGAYAQWLRQQSNNNRTTQDAIKLTREKSDLDELTTEQKLDQAKATKSMGADLATALGTSHNDPQQALQILQGMKNPDGSPKYPKAAQTMMDVYGGPKEWETIQKDRANDKIKQQEANANDVKAKADLMKADAAEKKAGKQEALDAQFEATAGLTPQQYLGTLDIAKQNTYKAIQEGRQTPLRLQGRDNSLTDAGQEFMRAFPNYDITKGKAFGQVRSDFEDKKIADSITSYGTLMGHAKMMYDNTGANSWNPLSKEHGKYEQDAHYLAVETAKALNPNGVAAEGEINKIESNLKSFNPVTRKSQIQNSMGIVGSKYKELQQRWDNALPDPQNYHPPMPGISQQALDDYTYVTSGGQQNPGAARQQQDQQQQQASQQNAQKVEKQVQTSNPPVPKGMPANSVYMKGPDGRFGYVSPNQLQAAIQAGGTVVKAQQ